MRSATELMFLARDFFRYLGGRDYFRQPQPLGRFFVDDRCYYNELRGKATWSGACAEGVPLLHIPALKQHLVLPTMAMLYGLGTADRYFTDGVAADRDRVRCIAAWLIANITPAGFFDNYSAELDPARSYHSQNSGMTQGLALSFALRAVHYELVDREMRDELSACAARILANMLLPMERNGTVLSTDDGPIVMEYCWKEDNVILNGWIYGVFGLFDWQRLRRDDAVGHFLDDTLRAMRKRLPAFLMPDGWTYYDSQRRICSPFYQRTTIALVDAMHRLTGDAVFGDFAAAARAADGPWNRIRFTANKIRDKFTDKEVYSST